MDTIQNNAVASVHYTGTLPDTGEVFDSSEGRDPLVFSDNAVPYRAFLEGRVKGKAYQLLLHLSNLELKMPAEKK